VVVVHPIDEGKILIDVGGPSPMVNGVVDEVLVCEPYDGRLVRRELAIDVLNL
jgi:hypothetical protein